MDNTGDFYSLNSSSILLRRTIYFITSETWSPRGLICPFRQISGFERVRFSPLVPKELWAFSLMVKQSTHNRLSVGSIPTKPTIVVDSLYNRLYSKSMPRWCNGSHAGLRSQCRKACRFESDLGHQSFLIKGKYEN